MIDGRLAASIEGREFMAGRRTQAERRETTRAAVLESAIRLFGEKGFADTSLEEIAADAGVTIRPIYHYFENKLGLFEAAKDAMEERIIDTYERDASGELDALAVWRDFITLCEDVAFRRILLVDGPTVLGRERWASSAVPRSVESILATSSIGGQPVSDLAARMLVGALIEAALAIAESDDPAATSQEAERLVASIVAAANLASTRSA